MVHRELGIGNGTVNSHLPSGDYYIGAIIMAGRLPWRLIISTRNKLLEEYDLNRIKCMCFTSLQWRHNGRDGVSNHHPHDCLPTVYSGADQRKHQSSASLAFMRGIRRWPVNSPHIGPVTQKKFPFDDVIMTRRITHRPTIRVYIAFHCGLIPINW